VGRTGWKVEEGREGKKGRKGQRRNKKGRVGVCSSIGHALLRPISQSSGATRLSSVRDRHTAAAQQQLITQCQLSRTLFSTADIIVFSAACQSHFAPPAGVSVTHVTRVLLSGDTPQPIAFLS